LIWKGQGGEGWGELDERGFKKWQRQKTRLTERIKWKSSKKLPELGGTWGEELNRYWEVVWDRTE